MPDPITSAVCQFQREKSGRDDLYATIHRGCQVIVGSVVAQFRFQIGTYVSEIADEKLHDCLGTFNCEAERANFRGYYRQALIRSAVDEVRRKKREQASDFEHDVPDDSQEVDMSRLRHYPSRKRNLVDRLTQWSSYPTILLDQRRRFAGRLRHASVAAPRQPECHSLQTERMEIWTDADHLQSVDGTRLNEIWIAFKTNVDSEAKKIDHAALAGTIQGLGGTVQATTWRQRVSRYSRELVETFTEDELVYFHLSIK